MMSDNPIEPEKAPPSYAAPVVLLVVGCMMVGLEYYEIAFKSRVVVQGLFLAPGAILLGIIGLIDPRVPASLGPGASDYPKAFRRIAMACWLISAIVGAALYFLLAD